MSDKKRHHRRWTCHWAFIALAVAIPHAAGCDGGKKDRYADLREPRDPLRPETFPALSKEDDRAIKSEMLASLGGKDEWDGNRRVGREPITWKDIDRVFDAAGNRKKIEVSRRSAEQIDDATRHVRIRIPAGHDGLAIITRAAEPDRRGQPDFTISVVLGDDPTDEDLSDRAKRLVKAFNDEVKRLKRRRR